MEIQTEKSFSQVLVRGAKVKALQARRLVHWFHRPGCYPRPRLASGDYPYLIYEQRLEIRRSDEDSHPRLEEGKALNLALAAPSFDGLALEPGYGLSFWRTLGRISAERGFDDGMELRAGCIVPALGGGICLLSNALFVMAARLGWKILERHGHTMEAVPCYSKPWGLDATVFWPYVDLRVEPRERVRLKVRVEGGQLVLAVESQQPFQERIELLGVDNRVGDGWRENRLLRRRFDTEGVLIDEDVIGHNRKKMLHSQQRRRNCLTCGESNCQARVEL